MARETTGASIVPGRGLAFFTLGASLHNIITRLKAQPKSYPKIDLSYSSTEPVQQPVIVGLPYNGLRLRFDGQDQRLRLVEILDFSKILLTYKNHELVRPKDGVGPSFKQVYHRLFGPSYPGEYIAPNGDVGTYILSYPGIAFSFPLQHAAWSKGSDFVALLSSTAASPAKSMAIFHASSWSEARSELYTKTPPFPRCALKDVPDEVEVIKIFGEGRLEFCRRSTSFIVQLGETTPQDLVAELGPPDAIYQKSDNRISIHGEQADTDEPEESDRKLSFYNYFHHGFDILVSHPDRARLIVNKVILHGNVPGSYPFNRHRRSRWEILNPIQSTSETPFDDIAKKLRQAWRDTASQEDNPMQREMVLNRGWGESPESSVELLGGWEGDTRKGDVQSLANTELFGFPGLLFEVLKNGSVSCLTIY